jgi:hypothetical protein
MHLSVVNANIYGYTDIATLGVEGTKSLNKISNLGGTAVLTIIV